MLRRSAAIFLLVTAFAAPAHAQGTPLMPGVTYEKTVQFTPHGAVVVHVLTAPARATRTASGSSARCSRAGRSSAAGSG